MFFKNCVLGSSYEGDKRSEECLNSLRARHSRVKDELVCSTKYHSLCKLIMLFRLISLSRTMFSFLSGVYVYVIAWALLGQDSGDRLGSTHLSDFAVSRIIGRVSQQLIYF